MHSRRPATKLRLALGVTLSLAALVFLAISALRPAGEAVAQGNSFQFRTLPPPTLPTYATPTRSCIFSDEPPCPTFTASVTLAATATKTPRPGLDTPVVSPSNTAAPFVSNTPSNTPSKSPVPSITPTSSVTPTSSATATPPQTTIRRFTTAVEELIPSEYVWLYLLVALTLLVGIIAGLLFMASRRK